MERATLASSGRLFSFTETRPLLNFRMSLLADGVLRGSGKYFEFSAIV